MLDRKAKEREQNGSDKQPVPPTAEITTISARGIVRIKFSKPMVLISDNKLSVPQQYQPDIGVVDETETDQDQAEEEVEEKTSE